MPIVSLAKTSGSSAAEAYPSACTAAAIGEAKSRRACSRNTGRPSRSAWAEGSAWNWRSNAWA